MMQFECSASTVVEGRAAAWKDEKGVHIRALGVNWTLTPKAALSLAHDIRCELDDEVSMYEPWAWAYCYRMEADDEHTVSIRRDDEGTALVLDNMDAEMLADWLEGSE